MEVFDDRRDAGRRLGAHLAGHLEPIAAPAVVLAIPRGGLPVGAEVARALGADFDVVVVRKLRAPHNPELGYGAVGPDGYVEMDEALVARLGLSREDVDREVADRREAVDRRLALYRSVAPAATVEGRRVIVVDDGVATGGTARQACGLARRLGAVEVILAVPVGPASARRLLGDVADSVVVLSEPAEFLAVGQAYRDFAQLDDETALAALREATGGSARPSDAGS